MRQINNLIRGAYHSRFFSAIMPTTVSLLQKELKGCKTVLDLGCGPDSPLQYCQGISYSVGVEPFKPYLERSRKKGIHTKYLNKKIEQLKFPPASFDAVVMIEVLEHLPKSEALAIIKKVERWAKCRVVVTTPNGFSGQDELDNNRWQRHLSGWTVPELQKLGFVCYGLAGLKLLRMTPKKDTMDEDITVSMRWRPRTFWFVVAALSQVFTYYLPFLSFELFCIARRAGASE